MNYYHWSQLSLFSLESLAGWSTKDVDVDDFVHSGKRKKIMRYHYRLAALIALLSAFTVSARAELIIFNVTGNPLISGYFTLDDALLDGSAAQIINNSDISDMGFEIFPGSPSGTWTFSDLISLPNPEEPGVIPALLIDSSGLAPRIIDARGGLADNGTNIISLFGNTSLITRSSDPFTIGDSVTYEIEWTVETTGSGIPVSEPSLLLWLCVGLLLCYSRKSTVSNPVPTL
ncbi:hypothetical protein [Alteromonas ponticola]|uniref:PEP-CTERM sorting domain-containing protein n=1 Tax=Alteromonas ponticola TaxID=2720613 RepID=A0ABX1QXI3_9ALTE|nr:hypothetical protein [Alteromonas ponticola]NMH58406.1 hypothetical protein [Alteromonas ponticola]